jgi:hypothetical protein
MHKQRVAFLAGCAPELQRQPDFGCHSNPTRHTNILRRQFWVGFGYALCLSIKYFDALPCDVFYAALFHHSA